MGGGAVVVAIVVRGAVVAGAVVVGEVVVAVVGVDDVAAVTVPVVAAPVVVTVGVVDGVGVVSWPRDTATDARNPATNTTADSPTRPRTRPL